MTADLVGLADCPFCGGTPHVRKDGGSEERYGYNFTVEVWCKCGGKIEIDSNKGSGGWCNEAPADAKKRAITAWNRRAELRALAGSGEPVLWWNGVTEDGVATGPSVTGKRNQWHDVPLYAHPVGAEDGARTTRLDLSVFDQPGDPRNNLIAKGWTPPGSGRGGVG